MSKTDNDEVDLDAYYATTDSATNTDPVDQGLIDSSWQLPTLFRINN